MKSVVPVVMAGILGIYGMIVAVIIVQKSKIKYNLVPGNNEYKSNQAYAHLASGLCCGFSSLVFYFIYYRLQVSLLVLLVAHVARKAIVSARGHCIFTFALVALFSASSV